MHALALAVSFLAAARVTFAVPVSFLEEDTFAQNGRDAQENNAEFALLKATDACDCEYMSPLSSCCMYVKRHVLLFSG